MYGATGLPAGVSIHPTWGHFYGTVGYANASAGLTVGFTPTVTGEFEVLCAELCGVGHPLMRGFVIIDDEAAYQAWLSEQTTFAALARPTRVGAADPMK